MVRVFTGYRKTSIGGKDVKQDFIYYVMPIKEDFRELLPKDQLEAHGVMEALKRKGILTDIGLPNRDKILSLKPPHTLY